MSLKIIFLGNHTVGVRVLEVLKAHLEVELVGIVAHPDGTEQSVTFESVSAFGTQNNIPRIKAKGKSPELFDFIREKAPDLLWIAGYRYLLPKSALEVPSLGGLNMHPSLLPEYRGRAPLNWAILNGDTSLGLTAHWITEGVDDGDIMMQSTYELDKTEDISDALDKLYPLYTEVTEKVLDRILKQDLRGQKQATGYEVYPGRKPEDGIVDWKDTGDTILNLIRAVAKPYSGAYTHVNDKKVTLWKASLDERPSKEKPGTIVEVGPRYLLIGLKDQLLFISDYEAEDGSFLEAGMRFSSK